MNSLNRQNWLKILRLQCIVKKFGLEKSYVQKKLKKLVFNEESSISKSTLRKFKK